MAIGEVVCVLYHIFICVIKYLSYCIELCNLLNCELCV